MLDFPLDSKMNALVHLFKSGTKRDSPLPRIHGIGLLGLHVPPDGF